MVATKLSMTHSAQWLLAHFFWQPVQNWWQLNYKVAPSLLPCFSSCFIALNKLIMSQSGAVDENLSGVPNEERLESLEKSDAEDT
jgi:hypothetical protein